MSNERNWFRRVWNNEFIGQVRGRSEDRLMVISSRSATVGGVGVLLAAVGFIVNDPDALVAGLFTAAGGFLGSTFASLSSASRDLGRIEANPKDQRN